MVVTIREEQKTDSGFAATLAIDGGGNFPIEIQDPFSPQQERELEWYFEGWLRTPFSDRVIAERAAASIKTYGEALFAQVFRADADAYVRYCAVRDGADPLQIEIEGKTPEFQALHWEAMRDPQLSRPFAVDCWMARKSLTATPIRAVAQPSPTINVLVVTARPDEEEDVGYRTISRPLIEALRNARVRVNVDLLRPGTFQALSEQLDQKPKGYYHLVHFDAHGALLTYEQLQEGVERNRLFNERFGRSDLAAYAGVKAFLFLEGEQKGKADPVEASELAALLNNKGIPICLLNACQSGKQVRLAEEVDTRETSLGSRLMTAGLQMVVAMGYSVTVTAAEKLMRRLYGELFAGEPVAVAVQRGRKELFNLKERRAYFRQTVDLEDWLLPVAYGEREVKLEVLPLPPEEEEKYYLAAAGRYRFPEPTYGFVGRDLEILKIEKGLLRRNILLLQGMGGTGKTTLLNYLREWWQTTRFAEQVFYFGYDERAWTLAQIVPAMGRVLFGRFEWAQIQAMSPVAQALKLREKLRAEKHILILDNLESVTGEPLAIQNTLPEAERGRIREFLEGLVGGETRVVLGSRGREEWLQAKTFQENVYPLKGLDPESRSQLAEKILARQVTNAKRREALQQDAAFGRLMKVLAGYPLAMEVVLGNLARQEPMEVLQALQASDVGSLDEGGEERTNNIVKCVEYSHSNLSEEAQKLLVCLAPFTSFLDRADLENYGKQLQQLAPFQNYPFEKFDGAIQEAVDWGLLSPIAEEMPRLLNIQPVFPYFLQTKLAKLDATTREALQEGFKNHYRGLAGQYRQLMQSKEAQQRQLGLFFCSLEYENLFQGLQICLQRFESSNIFNCLFDYLRLSNDLGSMLRLAEYVCSAHTLYPQDKRVGELGFEMVMALDRLAFSQLEAKQYNRAHESYHQALEILLDLDGVDEQQKRLGAAGMYHQLGRIAEEQREYDQAQAYYQQALEIKIEFGDRYEQASTYGQLGSVVQQQREYDQAQAYYQQALEIFIEFGDRYSQASTYHNLGSVVQEQREYEQAQAYYQQALEIFIEFGDRYSQASTYHQLGIVAQAQREYNQAQAYYQQALEIKIEFGDRHSQASTYHQLGIVAQVQREYGQAQAYYQQALEIFTESGDRYSQANIYGQLGMVAQVQREYGQAQAYYQQALEIFTEFGDRYSQANIYGQLGLLEKELGNLEAAKNHHLQGLQISVEFGVQQGVTFTLSNLARFYQATADESILTAAAVLLKATPEQLKEQLIAQIPGNNEAES